VWPDNSSWCPYRQDLSNSCGCGIAHCGQVGENTGSFAGGREYLTKQHRCHTWPEAIKVQEVTYPAVMVARLDSSREHSYPTRE